jgi:acetyltransferase-like isoleucine patch superfamily enzyme
LKGVNISDNVVVASNSTIVKDVTKSNVVASSDRVLKEHIKWTY